MITTVKIEATDKNGTYRNFVNKKKASSIIKWLRSAGYKNISNVPMDDPINRNNNEDQYIMSNQ